MIPHDILTQHIQQKNIAGYMHRFSRLLSSLSEHRWAADGYADVRNAHVQLLRNLDPGGTRNTVLAQRAQITKQTMGRLVRELTEAGYVSITPDPSDSRAQQVQLTERGQQFLVYLVSTLSDLEQAFVSTVGEHRYADFITTLHDLMHFVEQRHQQISQQQ